MKKARRTEEQIIGILQEHDAGAKCADLCRKHGMSEGTFYAWKAKYGGMTVSEAKRLKALEDENARLKRLLADQMLDMAAMKELLSKKWVSLRREPSDEISTAMISPTLWPTISSDPRSRSFLLGRSRVGDTGAMPTRSGSWRRAFWGIVRWRRRPGGMVCHVLC